MPYGGRVKSPDWGEEKLLRASALLRGTEIECRDFEASLDRVRAGEFIFTDPPYTVTHKDNGFVLYNETIFSWADQERLASALARASERGARFILTNADHPSIRALYRRFQPRPVTRSSVIAAGAANRRKVTELVVSNYPIEGLDN